VKRAFLVLGPESSGCRLVTRILMAAGCDGDGQHLQRWDKQLPPAESRLVVWRRSVPHHHVWPDIPQMAWLMGLEGYKTEAVVTVRRWAPMIASQVATFAHVPDDETAVANIHRAMAWIFRGIAAAGLPFHVVTYEGLCAPGGVSRLWADLGLQGDLAQVEKLYDANHRRGF